MARSCYKARPDRAKFLVLKPWGAGSCTVGRVCERKEEKGYVGSLGFVWKWEWKGGRIVCEEMVRMCLGKQDKKENTS